MNQPNAAANPPATEAGAAGTVRALWPYLWPHERRDLQMRVVMCLVLIVLAKLVTVFVPYTFMWATDALVSVTGGKVEVKPVWPWILGMPLLASVLYGLSRIVMTLLVQVRDGLFAKVSMHAVRKLALQTFRHMHNLSLRFHLERKTGGLTRVLERGRNGIESLTRVITVTLLPTIVEFVLVCLVLWLEFDARYIIIATAMIVLYMWFTIKTTEWRIGIRRTMNDSDTDANTKAIDSLLNFETVKYFGAEQREIARYDRSMEIYETSSVRAYISLAILNSGQAIIFTVALTLCMVLSAQDVIAGKASVGAFVMVNAMMIQLYQPMNFLGMVYREIKQSMTDIERMFEILEKSAEIADREDAKALEVTQATIRFEDVRFSYDPEREILKGISFEVPGGKTLAIVGPSGAGKSTVSRILFRFYDISGGRVTIDGQDIRDVTQESLRAAIGMVPQDTVLFNDTIRYNIGYGRADASPAEIEEAARMAQIGDFISTLPQGYDAMVGERGLKLSGGEKQRVAIARTILKAPPILILDEATSALDTHTEREIQSALDQVSADRTTIIIAHRLSTVVSADEIIVLEGGIIAERGSHAELLARGGLYASMWNRQREEEEAIESLNRTREGDKPKGKNG